MKNSWIFLYAILLSGCIGVISTIDTNRAISGYYLYDDSYCYDPMNGLESVAKFQVSPLSAKVNLYDRGMFDTNKFYQAAEVTAGLSVILILTIMFRDARNLIRREMKRK